jgi:hypothetical protein
MVFRGKPSKACDRCRKRKLRVRRHSYNFLNHHLTPIQCDLETPSCGCCLRANARCSGYRDVDILRILDETQTVRSRTVSKKANTTPRQSGTTSGLAELPLDLLVQARELFFGYYIADFCRIWDFLYPYFNSNTAPDHLNLSIDAVSLAFLSHQVTSSSAQQLGRQKYVSALRRINAALQSPNTAFESTTLETSLLLDLFEKIMSPSFIDEGAQSKRAHIDGALALVKLKGLDHFTDFTGLRVLERLSLNAGVYYFSQGEPVACELREIREHMAQYKNTMDPKWRTSGLVLEFTDLVSGIGKGNKTLQERTKGCIELDKQLEEISREAPPVWSYERKYLSSKETRLTVLGNFYDVYTSRTVTQRWNVLRIIRLFLCEDILASLSAFDDPDSRLHSQRAQAAIASTIQEICAAVPQMTDCEGAARHKLPNSSVLCVGSKHNHTLSQFLDAYIMIYPLYVVSWSRECSDAVRTWVIRQLECIAEHFGVKEAKAVVEILRNEKQKPRVEPGEVYRLLGSYAFAA